MNETPTVVPFVHHRLRDAYAGAAAVVAGVLAGRNLDSALETVLSRESRPQLRAAIKGFSYEALRAFGIADAVLRALRNKTLPDPVLRALFCVVLPDIRAHVERAHAIVDEAVEATVRLGRIPAKGLVNAILRGYLRKREVIDERALTTDVPRYQHPDWWIRLVRRSYPRDCANVLAASNLHPPMTLRVNRRRTSAEAYLSTLEACDLPAVRADGDAVTLVRPVAIERLPGFDDGLVSVQDVAAQLAPIALQLEDGHRVLDACAAPGGKTGHILETADVQVTALELDRDRLSRVESNLQRLGLRARLIVGDATQPDRWWDGRLFDRILLDAPCSGSGVVRRHPDIKWLRRAKDIEQFARVQSAMLAALWRTLAPGGRLVYVTCSIFPDENEAPVKSFLASHPDAVRVSPGDGAESLGQHLPSPAADGFFYAALEKR